MGGHRQPAFPLGDQVQGRVEPGRRGELPRPAALEIVIRKFRTAKATAYTAAVLFTVFFMGLWPGSMLSVDILDLNGFNIWTTISRGWAFTAAAVIIILPLFQEVAAILKQLKKNVKEGRMEDRSH